MCACEVVTENCGSVVKDMNGLKGFVEQSEE